MRTMAIAVVAGLLAALVATSGAHAGTWDIDGAQSSAQFTIRHLMVRNVKGEFHSVRGTAVVPDDDPLRARIDATIAVASLDTGIERRDEHLKSADYFDAATFPTMTFASKRVERAGDGRYTLVGDLTLHGVTREVALAVEDPARPTRNPSDGGERTAASATVTLDRNDFGMTGGFIVGDEVHVRIEVELVKQD